MEDCIFCKIADGEMEAEILYSDEKVLAFRDINPKAPIHFLVIPKKHISTALDLTAEDADILLAIFAAIKKVAEDEGIASTGVRIVNNVGRAAGQVVFHLHFHVLGGRQLMWPPG